MHQWRSAWQQEQAFEEGYGNASELAVQVVYKGRVQKHLNSGKGEKGAIRVGKGQWSLTGGKKGGKGQEKGGKGDTRVC